MSRDAYREAGVDIDAGEALVERIKPLAMATSRAGVLGSLGGFGGLFALDGRFRDPVLVSGTDGVGTKLMLAQRLGVHDTIGIDLVAMCVNDIVCSGAEPLFFLDYFACGKLDVDVAEAVIRGVAEGCRQAGCALIGGETAEMPGMYAPGHYDLAGFAVGAVERDAILDPANVHAGYKLIGVASSGLHSNGYSLVRRLLVDPGLLPLDEDPGGLGRTLGEALLAPTRIYASTARDAIAAGAVGIAHITGGGITGNVPRMLPSGLGAVLQRGSWSVPPIFRLLQQVGRIDDTELHHTFNSGLGLVIAAPREAADDVCAATGGRVVGDVVNDTYERAVVR